MKMLIAGSHGVIDRSSQRGSAPIDLQRNCPFAPLWR